MSASPFFWLQALHRSLRTCSCKVQTSLGSLTLKKIISRLNGLSRMNHRLCSLPRPKAGISQKWKQNGSLWPHCATYQCATKGGSLNSTEKLLIELSLLAWSAHRPSTVTLEKDLLLVSTGPCVKLEDHVSCNCNSPRRNIPSKTASWPLDLWVPDDQA